MSSIRTNLVKLLTIVPVIIMWTFVNVLICAVMAGVTFLQLIAVYNWNKTISIVVAIFVAILVHIYLFLQPQIRRFINTERD